MSDTPSWYDDLSPELQEHFTDQEAHSKWAQRRIWAESPDPSTIPVETPT
jgi:hypothetical protein